MKTEQLLFEKYKALSRNQKIAIIVSLFILGLLILPNVLVYAIGAIASHKLIGDKWWKYGAVTVLTVATFFSGVLLIAGDTTEPVASTEVEEVTTRTPQEPEKNDVVQATSTASTTTDIALHQENTESNDGAEETGSTPVVVSNNIPVAEPETTEQTTTANTYEVVDIVDGDTVKLSINGNAETVRLIGIDTPESVHPTDPVECFGVEASNRAKQLLAGKKVQFETDSSQDTRDRYGRLLGYVILPDGRNFNKVMIEEGYAYEYTYSTPYKHQTAFKAAQASVEASGRGLWASGACADFEEAEELESEPAPEEPVSTCGGKWYASSYHTAEYYYHESCDGWQGLSKTYLTVYDSEAAIQAAHSDYTRHPDCEVQ